MRFFIGLVLLGIVSAIVLPSFLNQANKAKQKDNYTYLLTCAHVVEDVGGKENVLVNDIPTEVLAIGDVKNFDLAVLGVKNLEVELFSLTSLSASENVKFWIAGHFLYGEEKKILLETVEGTLGKKRFVRQNN